LAEGVDELPNLGIDLGYEGWGGPFRNQKELLNIKLRVEITASLIFHNVDVHQSVGDTFGKNTDDFIVHVVDATTRSIQATTHYMDFITELELGGLFGKRCSHGIQTLALDDPFSFFIFFY